MGGREVVDEKEVAPPSIAESSPAYVDGTYSPLPNPAAQETPGHPVENALPSALETEREQTK